MKVGDLVQLSAYGKKLKNYYSGRDNDLALVLKVRWDSMFTIRWCSDGKRAVNVDRRDIVYAKKATRG
tara:strand:+ start:387 stop:590 length:204 start_codon:yes stop_codon:yes gene_type:complete